MSTGAPPRTCRIVVVAFLLVCAPVVGTVPAGALAADGAALAQADDADNSSNATDAYVTERGDVVLVYDADEFDEDEEEEEEETPTEPDEDEEDDVEFGDSPRDRVELGAALGRGLVYGLLVSNRSVDSPAAANTTGGVTFLVAPDRVAGDVRLRTVRPEQVRELDVDVEGERTTANARATVSGTATVGLSGEAAAGQLLRSADVSARASFGPSSLAVDAKTAATFERSPSPPLSVSATVTETDGSYTLSVERNTTISEFEREDWVNESVARETLRERYVAPAEGVGETTLTLESYALTNTSAGPRLAVEYTVEYENVERSLRPALAASLARNEQLNLTQAEASRLARQFLAAEIQRLSVTASLRDGELASALRLRVEGYDRPLLASAAAIEAYEFDANGSEQVTAVAEGFRTRLEAQRAADLTRTYTLEASYDRPGDRTARVDVNASYRTDNWRAYVAELRQRDVRLLNVTFDLHATAADERIVANGSLSLGREALLRDLTERALNASNASVGPDTDDDVNLSDREDLIRTLRAFREADFRVARVDVNFTAERVTVEFGAKFDNASAFLSRYENESDTEGLDVEQVEEVVVRQNGTQRAKTYVYLDGAVPARPNESAVRTLPSVNESTTVHMPGEWERGSLPRLDRERAYAYLGVEPPEPTPTPTPLPPTDGGPTGTDGTDTSSPGFGVLAAALALAAAALLARRD